MFLIYVSEKGEHKCGLIQLLELESKLGLELQELLCKADIGSLAPLLWRGHGTLELVTYSIKAENSTWSGSLGQFSTPPIL